MTTTRTLVLVVSAAALAACVAWGLKPAPGRTTAAGPAVPAADKGIVCVGHVDLENGVAALTPLLPGRVKEVLVKEDETVAADQVLLRLDDRADRLRLDKAKAALAAAEAALAQAKLLDKQQSARETQQEAAEQAAKYRAAAARRLLERKQELVEIKQANPLEVAAALEQVKELDVAVKAESARLTELKANDPALGVRRAAAEAAAARAAVAEAEQALAECSLKAPQAGKVLRVQARPGDVVGGAGQPVIVFAAAEPRIVRAEVLQEFAAKVKPGQPVVVEDESGAGHWKGKVLRVSDWYTQRRVVIPEPLQRNDVRTVECLIAVESGGEPLRIGQRMRVRIGE